MNLRDREFPDRRGAGAKRRRAPSRPAPAFVAVDSRLRTGILACGPWLSANATASASPHADAGPARVRPSAPGSRSARSWCSTRAGCGCRPARSPPTAVAAELERLDRGLDAARERGQPGRDRGPDAARSAVCRHPGGALPDDRRPDLARATPARSSSKSSTSAEHAVLDVLEELCRRGWNGSPARTWRPAPPMSATSRRGS